MQTLVHTRIRVPIRYRFRERGSIRYCDVTDLVIVVWDVILRYRISCKPTPGFEPKVSMQGLTSVERKTYPAANVSQCVSSERMQNTHICVVG